jgi:TolB-like protein/DNA-binding winged helix-turn-helix (wHTH) protein/Tfp pilus assembly protein PilF
VLRFGPYEVHLRTQELFKGESRLRLPPQAFQVLRMLLERPGELVTRDDLRQALWSADTFVDFDHGLNNAIKRIRDVLNDSVDAPVYIGTLPRLGYRFVGQVARNGNGTAPAIVAESPSVFVPEAQESKRLSRATRRHRLSIAILSVVVVCGALTTLWLLRRSALSPQPQIRSLAVLPLTNLSGDPDQEYFADGMTEELTTDLGKISALRVISRTSAMQYKGTNKPLSQIARELNVDAVAEGTVARSGSHVRITANLLQASPEKHLWAESYEIEIRDAFEVRREIAQAVAREIQVKLTPQEQHLLAVARPVNPEAQDLYLRGLYTMRGSEKAESSEKAIKYFQQAIEKDPNYAAAHTALAHAYAVWIPGMTRSPRELIPKAREFARKALSLDNTLADAHCVLGMIQLFYDWDWSAAEQEYQQTVALNPNYVGVYAWHSRGLVARGRTDEGIAEANRMISLSPSPLSWDYPIWVFILARRYDLARDRGQKLLEVAPDWVWAHFEMAQVYEQQGELKEAADEFLKAEELFQTDPIKVAQLQESIAKSGPQGYWRRTLENYKESAKSNYVSPVLAAEACIRVGDKECAFEWLEKGFEERDDLMINLKVEPLFDSLHSDPRFQGLVRRVGIPQ